jgi:hypothetical protein
MEMAAELVASVAVCCTGQSFPLILVDNHLPYPAAILQVFGVIQHRRRRHGRGRFKHPRLKAPLGLWAGVVEKVRNARGRVLKVKTRALFGRLKDIQRRIRRLRIGREINTAHIERLNGTLRGQQARLTRRTRNGSRLGEMLQWALWLWRDLYNWVRPHGSLEGRTPAMALGLTQELWSIHRYVRHPVHVSDLQREVWLEQRQAVLTSALDDYQRKKRMPTS